MVRKKEIETKVMENLLVKRPQLGRFYLLPKIHKRKTNVPGRSVISNNQTATENISSFLDFHLKNIVPTIPHILEDTKDFLKRINDIGEIPSGSLLVTFDVVRSYPHIPHEYSESSRIQMSNHYSVYDTLMAYSVYGQMV